MSPPECGNPVGLATLLAYWLGELDEPREREIEEHFLVCAACSAELAELASLADGIRSCARQGALRAVVTPAFVDRLTESGLQVRQYSLDRYGSVTCAVAPQDDLAIARLRMPLADVRRLDFVLLRVESGGEERIDDVPFDATGDEVIVIPRTSASRTMPTFTSRIRAVAVDDAGERVLGDYTLNHTPWPAV